ncbi:MarR family winged helix-turn-helix transcriptional regulator [Streptomyces sp. NPDC091271]|uniref:MarR family winged helix-turn-helix transcriptional regulator n=1 Tax=Streptomyces sp. NPDC091271 TaxID=3365980 RepID=UPI00381B91B9
MQKLRHATGPVIARRPADQLQLSPAGISKSLAKPEGRGFIERVPNPVDRRAALVTVTPAGAEAVDNLFPRQLAVESELLSGLGEDRAKMLEALTTLARVMERHLT